MSARAKLVTLALIALLSNALWLYFTYGRNEKEKAVAYIEVIKKDGATFMAASIKEEELTGQETRDVEIAKAKLSEKSGWQHIATIRADQLDIRILPDEYKRIFIFKEVFLPIQ